VYLSLLFCSYFVVLCFVVFFVVTVVLCIFIFFCTSVGLLPPGESPIAVSNDDDDDDNNNNNNNNDNNKYKMFTNDETFTKNPSAGTNVCTH
jgi:flagellar basal body-associated protein FliL